MTKSGTSYPRPKFKAGRGLPWQALLLGLLLISLLIYVKLRLDAHTMLEARLDAYRKLYGAIESHDRQQLLESLAPNFSFEDKQGTINAVQYSNREIGAEKGTVRLKIMDDQLDLYGEFAVQRCRATWTKSDGERNKVENYLDTWDRHTTPWLLMQRKHLDN